jgi:hypothetical protein
VIEHVEDDRKTIEEAVRSRDGEGNIVVFAPNRLFPFETTVVLRGQLPLRNIRPSLAAGPTATVRAARPAYASARVRRSPRATGAHPHDR